MKKSTNFTTKKLSLVLALAVAGQLLISAPAQAQTSNSSLTPQERFALIIAEIQRLTQLALEACGLSPEQQNATIGQVTNTITQACPTCQQNQVPEPLTIFGVGATLASLPAFKKYYNNKKNNQEEIS